jgi:hypothetical protein
MTEVSLPESMEKSRQYVSDMKPFEALFRCNRVGVGLVSSLTPTLFLHPHPHTPITPHPESMSTVGLNYKK